MKGRRAFGPFNGSTHGAASCTETSGPPENLPPSVVAGLVLLVKELLPACTEWPRTTADVLHLTGAGKSQAYEVLGRLRSILPTVLSAPGRPPSLPFQLHGTEAILIAVRDYLLRHPGATCGGDRRRTYSDDFRRFVVGLMAPGQPAAGRSAADLAFASGVPLGTVKEWLQAPPAIPCESVSPHHDAAAAQHPVVDPPATQQTATWDWIRAAHLQQIASLWLSWKGTFLGFGNMLRTEHRLPYAPTYIGNFLHSIGLRQRRRRTAVEAPWSSDTFRLLFPSAQWLGDGTTIAVTWQGQKFCFNLEALQDPASDSLVGFAVTDAEDAEALRQAYEMGVATTGAPPLAVTLDNRPSNHAQALEDTMVLRATPYRGQAKAPIEGHFGLFQQSLPPLVICGGSAREAARSVLQLIMTAWSVGRNGKPRRRLKGHTPAEAYTSSHPTPQETRVARDWFEELYRRQERARLTREARRDPVRKEQLQRGLAELNIPDPEHKLATALACHSREAIARGLATFAAKLDLGTLPPHAEHGRYLGGIIRQLHTRLEIDQLSVHLLQQRIRLRDITLAPLIHCAQQARETMPLATLPENFVDRALSATCLVDFRFWAHAAAESLSLMPASRIRPLYQSLCRRTAASFKTNRERRQDLVDLLAEAVAAAD